MAEVRRPLHLLQESQPTFINNRLLIYRAVSAKNIRSGRGDREQRKTEVRRKEKQTARGAQSGRERESCSALIISGMTNGREILEPDRVISIRGSCVPYYVL